MARLASHSHAHSLLGRVLLLATIALILFVLGTTLLGAEIVGVERT